MAKALAGFLPQFQVGVIQSELISRDLDIVSCKTIIVIAVVVLLIESINLIGCQTRSTRLELKYVVVFMYSGTGYEDCESPDDNLFTLEFRSL